MKEKRCRRFSTLDLIRANPSSAQDLRASPMKEKRCRRFSTSDLIRAISSSAGLATSALARSSPRHLQRARSAKFPARLATSAEREVPRAEIARVSYERKTLQAFFNFRLKRANPSSGRSRLSKNFSFWKVSLILTLCDV